MKIGIACDHAGYDAKLEITRYLISKGHEVINYGTNSKESVDYPDFAHPLAEAVEKGNQDMGITICGSGNGINMVANKHQGIRSALCWNDEIARLARQHNDANICSVPARFISKEEYIAVIDAFINTDFEGGRHQRRVDKIPIK